MRRTRLIELMYEYVDKGVPQLVDTTEDVWDSTKIIALFEIIRAQLPIGQVVLFDDRTSNGIQSLVGGQQLIAIYKVLTEEYMYFDLIERKFVIPSTNSIIPDLRFDLGMSLTTVTYLKEMKRMKSFIPPEKRIEYTEAVEVMVQLIYDYPMHIETVNYVRNFDHFSYSQVIKTLNQ